MTSSLLQMIKEIWWAMLSGSAPGLFLPIWILATGLTAVGVEWVVGHAAAPTVQKDKVTAITRARRYALSGSVVAALTLIVLLLAGYIVLSLKWEDFADYDASFFTLFTLKGHYLAPMIWPGNGRFFPLGYQEFNLISNFTGSVVGYHVMPIVQLLIVAGILFLLDDELSITARLALTALVLILPSTVTCFTGLVFPDRNFVFWLACLVFFVKLFGKTGSSAWAVAAAICAQIMIYYKETAFLLLLGFAIGRLILRCRRADGSGWDYSRIRDRESRLDLCLFSLGLLFLLYYAAVMMHHPNMQYAHMMRFPLVKVLLDYVELDLLVWVFVAVVLRRAYLILRRRVAPLPLWDGLAFGGVLCFVSYIYLRLCAPRYLAPLDFIAVLYVGRIAVLSWGKMRWRSKAATLVLVVAVLLQGMSLSAFCEFERKNIIHAKAELADAIVLSQSRASHVQRLFFPFSHAYPVTEFASYLVYRGIRVEGYETTAEPAAPGDVIIVSMPFTKDGPCVEHKKFICHAGSEPNPGDLVIELPDDIESLAEISPYRKAGEPLFSYEPHPRIPQWMYPLFSRLRVVSDQFRRRELPDRWLHASMTRWR
ncbi:MAG: hypothetical protein ACLQVJ_19870 [Syntrophobacteraceae bacterium]